MAENYEWRTFRHYGESLNDAVFWSVMRQKRHTDPFRVHLDNAVSQSSSQQKCNFAFWGVSSHELISKWVVQTSIFFLSLVKSSSQNSSTNVTKSQDIFIEIHKYCQVLKHVFCNHLTKTIWLITMMLNNLGSNRGIVVSVLNYAKIGTIGINM